jgi:hypothetical protein
MTDEFDAALRRALRREDPGTDFSRRVISRLASHGAAAAPAGRAGTIGRALFRTRWLPVALAACLIAAFGVAQIRQRSLETARATQARAQLLEALRIASTNINIVRAAVAREENPDS